MCTFCNTSLACVERKEEIFYGCISSTTGRRRLSTLCEMDQSGEIKDIFCVRTGTTSDGRFSTGAEQRPVLSQGDDILELT